MDHNSPTSQPTKHWWLYVLRLEDGKFYVGITSKTPEIRMNEHLQGIRGAYWTMGHKPIEIIYKEDLGTIPKRTAEKRENKLTRALMKQRGINNVRGGDLKSTEEYIARFGYIWPKDIWNMAMVVIVEAVIIITLAVRDIFISTQ